MRALSPRVLRELRAYIGATNDPAGMEGLGVKLEAELQRLLTPRRAAAPAKKRRAAKKATKAEETRRIRAVVFHRARNLCEACGGMATDLEHMLGRKVPQTTANCAALCRACHRDRTDGRPSYGHWWRLYREIWLGRGEAGLAREAERKADAADMRRAG